VLRFRSKPKRKGRQKARKVKRGDQESEELKREERMEGVPSAHLNQEPVREKWIQKEDFQKSEGISA